MHAQKAALTQLTIAPANRIAMHKHPGAEVLYVLKGHARILGPTGVAPEKLDEGMAVLIPGGMPHAIENMGRTSSAVLLDVFAPMGPERVYRDPKDEAGRAAFEVIRGAPPAAPAGAKFDGRRRGARRCRCSRARGRSSRCSSPAKTGNKCALRGHPGGGAGRGGAAQQPPGIGGDPLRAVGRRRASRSAARRSPSAPKRRCTSPTASRTPPSSPARTRR